MTTRPIPPGYDKQPEPLPADHPAWTALFEDAVAAVRKQPARVRDELLREFGASVADFR